MALAVNPRNIALLNRVPYLSCSEYQSSPEALDLSDIVQGGNSAAQLASLARVIGRASSWIDQYCFPVGSGGTLAASLDTDTGWSRIRRDGYLPLVCRFKPILELDACQFGWVPSQMNALTDTADIIFGDKVIWVPTWSVSMVGGSTWPPVMPVQTGRAYAQWSYVDGYPHTVLAGPVVAGATVVPVVSTLGVYPGTLLTINDGASTETIMVESVGTTTLGGGGTYDTGVYDSGAYDTEAGEDLTTVGSVTVAAPLAFAHVPPYSPDSITVSALPAAVNQAAILLVSVLLETRGDNALVLDSSGNMTTAGSGKSGADQALQVVGELLDPFRIVT
jgi:hypothetical protein